MDEHAEYDDDRQLVKKLLDGDEKAFTAFFRGYYPRLYRFALSRLDHDEEAAKEVAQEAICTAITKLDSYRGDGALFTWLCSFCQYKIYSQYREKKRMAAQVDPNDMSEEINRSSLATKLKHVFDDPELSVYRSQLQRLVRATLDSLPPHYEEALKWKYVEGVSVKEIAKRLQRSPKATESVLTRARNRFRDAFSELFEPSKDTDKQAVRLKL